MIDLVKTTFSNPDFLRLIVELDKEFLVRYPFVHNLFTPFNLMNENARVMIAYDNATRVDCGDFRPVDENTIEIKRMYTIPLFRNLGIGKQLLLKLE